MKDVFSTLQGDLEKLPDKVYLPYGERGTEGDNASRSFYGAENDIKRKLEEFGISDEFSSIWAKMYKQTDTTQNQRVFDLNEKVAQNFLNNFKSEMKEKVSNFKGEVSATNGEETKLGKLSFYKGKTKKGNDIFTAMNTQHLWHQLMRAYNINEKEAKELSKSWKSIGINPEKTSRMDQRLFSGPRP